MVTNEKLKAWKRLRAKDFEFYEWGVVTQSSSTSDKECVVTIHAKFKPYKGSIDDLNMVFMTKSGKNE